MTFLLAASPYWGTAAATVLKLATAALDAGHRPAIFATADGVYGFVKGQKPTAVFDVGAAAETFLALGGEVHL
ncbi:MAG: DsrE family protein [Candidatus Rokubacteria bacterium]|nr:DsrE family protein [Candidatus Rokubacteria bacterium]